MSQSPNEARPLDGLRVIDLSRALAGPYATLLLAGLGAEVIKIEDPKGGDLARDNSPYIGRDGITVTKRHPDDVSISHLTRSRGKHGVSLNLKHPHAQKVFQDLVKTADIVVENFTPGTADRLGVGYQAAQAANPAVIYCSLSGFGQQENDRIKAMDVIVQALSGAMYTTGEPDAPPVRLGIPFADLLAPVFGVIGILSALEMRHRTGAGQHVDVSMLGALTSLVGIENWQAMRLAGLPGRSGPTVHRLSPFGIFKCSDGYVAIVATHDGLTEGLFRAIGDESLASEARFATRDSRVANAEGLEARIEEWSSARSVTKVVAALNAQGVPVAPVRQPEEALDDPCVVARGETEVIAHPTYATDMELRTSGIPIRFSGAASGFAPCLPVQIGEHNDEVYRALLGYSEEEIAELRSSGAV